MIKLIGKKIGMTSLFDEQGNNVACTVIQAGPCVVTQVKTKETDGYEAVQIGWGTKKDKKVNAAEKGHFKKSKAQPTTILEIRNADGDMKVGDTYGIEIFEEGQYVDVVGTSKGKGFQGVVKRHGFAGVGQATHGQHNRLRAPGSIGAASYPARVFKGMRMAGQMGNKRVKMMELEILKLDAEKNLVIVKGAIPGHRNSIVVIER